jgi:hypothetical protein
MLRVTRTTSATATAAFKRAIRRALNKRSRLERSAQLLYKPSGNRVFLIRANSYYKFVKPRYRQENVPMSSREKLTERVDPTIIALTKNTVVEILLNTINSNI